VRGEDPGSENSDNGEGREEKGEKDKEELNGGM